MVGAKQNFCPLTLFKGFSSPALVGLPRCTALDKSVNSGQVRLDHFKLVHIVAKPILQLMLSMGPLVNPIKDREFSNPTINYKFILIFLRKIIKNVEYKKNMSRPFKFFSFLSNYYNQFQILILKILSPPSLYDYDGVYGFDNTFRYPKFRR